MVKSRGDSSRTKDDVAYSPPTPELEAFVMVRVEWPTGSFFLRFPYSTMAQVYGLRSDKRDKMISTFQANRFQIMKRLGRKVAEIARTRIYTVTPEDMNEAASAPPRAEAWPL